MQTASRCINTNLKVAVLPFAQANGCHKKEQINAAKADLIGNTSQNKTDDKI